MSMQINVTALPVEKPKFQLFLELDGRRYDFQITAQDRRSAIHQAFSDLANIRTELNNMLQSSPS